MAGKKNKKKSGSSKVAQMRAMREGSPAANEATDKETAAQKKKRMAVEKKDAAKAEKLALKAQEKQRKEELKAQRKKEREEKAAARKAEKEAKRKPKTGALTIEQVSTLNEGIALAPLPELDDEQRTKLAAEGDKEIRQLEGRFISAAIIVRGYMHYKLWEVAPNPESGKLGFKSIEKWFASAMPRISRAERFKIIKAAELVVPHIPEEDLRKMKTRNVQLLINYPKAKLADPEIIEAAKGSEKKFRQTAKKKAPESGIEETEHLMVPQSIRELFNEALAAIMALHELPDKYEGMEGLAIYFMQGLSEHPDFKGMSNRDAYAALLAREEDEPDPEELHVNGEQSA